MITAKKIFERIFKKMNTATIINARKEYIENVANEKLKEWNLNTPRFDLIKVLKDQEKFEIVLIPMPDDTTGLILMNDNEKIGNTNLNNLIAVNANLQRDPNYIQRRRFIIAHEYAHSQLHKQNNILFAHRDTQRKDTPEEQEADFFARCLLMPQKLMNEVMNSETYKRLSDSGRISYICEIFNVTEKKAKQRLKEIGTNA